MSLEVYFERARSLLAAVQIGELDSLRAAAEQFAATVEQDGLVYTFGTGHSSLLAAEGLYRAGGLACVSAMLESIVTFEPGGVASSAFERKPGLASVLIARYPIGANDTLVVFSNSGVNALPVEVAQGAKLAGATVVAVTSKAYAELAPRSALDGNSLVEVADIVIDNHVPPGDAIVPFYEDDVKAASVSTVAGAFIWNALIAHAVSLLEERGIRAPIYVSGNMPEASATNQALIDRYRKRVRHL